MARSVSPGSSRKRKTYANTSTARTAQGSSQSQGSSSRRSTQQTQSSGRRRAAEEDEEMGEGEGEEGSGGEDEGSDPIMSRAYDLVRLALFAERSRGTFKRDDINKKVLGATTGRAGASSYNAVFDAAQKILRDTFGFEIHELMTRAERDQAMAPPAPPPTDGPKEKAPAPKAKKTTASSRTYIVRNVLPSSLLASMVTHNPDIQLAAYGTTEPPEYEREEDRPDDTLVAWKEADHMAVVGILHVILALILANGRSIPDPQLRAQLKKLGLKSGVIIPTPPHTVPSKPLTLELILSQLIKSNYLDRQRISIGGEPSKGRKRTAPSTTNEDGEGGGGDEWEWKWGTRAIGEINEAGVAELVVEFMGDRFREREVEAEEEEEGEGAASGSGAARRGRNEGGKSEARTKHEKAVMNDLVRSAGGALLSMKVERAVEGVGAGASGSGRMEED